MMKLVTDGSTNPFDQERMNVLAEILKSQYNQTIEENGSFVWGEQFLVGQIQQLWND